MEEWKKYKLEEVCSRLRSGKGIKSDCISNIGLFPVIGGNGMRGYTNKSNFKGECAVIGRQGANCGNVSFFMGEAYMTEHAVVAVGNELADSYFLARLLSLMHLGNLSAQSAQPGLSIQTLSKQIICLPSISYQREISTVLKSLDDKIALNRAINHNLEAMAKQLYDYWFVQFDFPDANGRPYKSSGGKMVWNEKLHREIPHDWDVVNLSEYLNVYTEKVTANNLGASCKYAPIEVLPRRRMSFNECSPIENAVSGLCRFRKKQILLSNRRVYFHKVCIAAFDGVTRDTVIILNQKNKALLGYAYQIVNDDAFIEYATRHSYGSEQPVLSWESAKIYKTFKPRNQLDIIYSKRICPIIDSVIKNELEIAKLIKLRDSLLPLLMNGQVKVGVDGNCD